MSQSASFGRCQSCGAFGVVKQATFYQNIGLIVMRMSRTVSGAMCKPCIHKHFWESTSTTLFLGWWGVISFFITPFILLANIVQYIACLGMPGAHHVATLPKALSGDRPFKSGRTLALSALSVAVLAATAALWIWSAHAPFAQWSAGLARADKDIAAGDLDAARKNLRAREVEAAQEWWAKMPSIAAGVHRAREQIKRKQVAIFTLTDWRERLARITQAIDGGNLQAARQDLGKLEGEAARTPPWQGLEAFNGEVASLQGRIANARKGLDEAERLEEAAATWSRLAATIEAALQKEDYWGADQALGDLEFKQGLIKPTRKGASARRLESVRERIVELRSRLDLDKQRYLARLNDLLERVRPPLSARNGAAVTAAIADAEKERPDPMLQSIALLATRRLKLGTVSPPELYRFSEDILAHSLPWRSARLQDTAAGYVKYLKDHSASPFADEARSRLVDIEVAEIHKSRPGALPSATQISPGKSRTFSVINVHNNTSYELTLRYSGPDSFSVVLAPNEKSAVEILVGTYSVAASVNSAGVKNYAGDQVSSGGNYQITFYIQSSAFPMIMPPLLPIYGFEPWPMKRLLPAYLR